jgi:hypothetical protein
VRQEIGLLELFVEPIRERALRVFLAAGAGAYRIDESGTASAPYISTQAGSWSALVAAGAGASIRITRSIRIVPSARVLVAVPRQVVSFASDRVATAMSPGAAGSLDLTVEL